MSKKQRVEMDDMYDIADVWHSTPMKIGYLKGLLGYTHYSRPDGKYSMRRHLRTLERAYFLHCPS